MILLRKELKASYKAAKLNDLIGKRIKGILLSSKAKWVK
jgi:hypothetical protein